MADGTVIPIYVKRLHKSNAEYVLEEAKSTKQYIERLIIAMASSKEKTEEGFWYEHVASEIPSLLEEYADSSFKETMAVNLLDDPDSCEDELEGL